MGELYDAIAELPGSTAGRKLFVTRALHCLPEFLKILKSIEVND